jgi:addiction module HigA family antidote
VSRYALFGVIRSFRGAATERLWSRRRAKGIDPRIERVTLRKLAMLDAAEALEDLRIPPGNRLEALKGDRAGQHSIRINQQWRICFVWTAAGPEDVQIVDYHEEVDTMAAITPVHPGEVLLEEFLGPLGVTQHHLAVAVGVPPRRINEIVHGKRRISADTALRLARYFGTTDRFWLNLQTRFDLEVKKDLLGAALDAIHPLQSA